MKCIHQPLGPRRRGQRSCSLSPLQSYGWRRELERAQACPAGCIITTSDQSISWSPLGTRCSQHLPSLSPPLPGGRHGGGTSGTSAGSKVAVATLTPSRGDVNPYLNSSSRSPLSKPRKEAQLLHKGHGGKFLLRARYSSCSSGWHSAAVININDVPEESRSPEQRDNCSREAVCYGGCPSPSSRRVQTVL